MSAPAILLTRSVVAELLKCDFAVGINEADGVLTLERLPPHEQRRKEFKIVKNSVDYDEINDFLQENP